MLTRKISKIDEEKCIGCGICTQTCHEGALKLVNGKAKLVSTTQCDGLGRCLPVCPQGAITLEDQPVADIPAAVPMQPGFGCPGSRAARIERDNAQPAERVAVQSQLQQWPCQIKLVPPAAPYFNQADLLIAADCTAYAYANMHQDFMQGKITLIGCPKLDEGNYADKLGQIFQANHINSITVVRMEKPCCGGLVHAAQQALLHSGKEIPFQFVVIGIDGRILE